jgi:hypothetical protein
LRCAYGIYWRHGENGEPTARARGAIYLPALQDLARRGTLGAHRRPGLEHEPRADERAPRAIGLTVPADRQLSRRQTLQDLRGALRCAAVRGAPDWVIEILSPSTAKKDLHYKFDLYQRHCVREYWVVDPDARAVHAWTLEEDGRFGKERLFAKGEAVASDALEGFVVNSKELFADID